MNPEFDKMTVYEKRVAVAKDVLEQLEAERYFACRAHVVRLYGMDIDAVYVFGEGSAQSLVVDMKPCEVCAKGAVLLSTIRLFNQVSRNELLRAVQHSNNVRETPMLRDIFTRKMLDEMEYLFEQREFSWMNLSVWEIEQLDTFLKSWLRHASVNKRLACIFTRLIDSGGRKIVLDLEPDAAVESVTT